MLNFVYFVHVENKDQEEREEFDELLGLNPDQVFDDDDPLVPAELIGVRKPSWWKDGASATPESMGNLF